MLNDELELLNIATEIGKLLPQLQDFIQRFHETITQYNINVITDASGTLDIDVSSGMADTDIDKCTVKIRVLDRLILDRQENIHDLFTKGNAIETRIKAINNSYVSVLTEKSQILRELNNSYRH
jgi:tRNA A-37 threonylcarbamoyl transferase component Bud32